MLSLLLLWLVLLVLLKYIVVFRILGTAWLDKAKQLLSDLLGREPTPQNLLGAGDALLPHVLFGDGHVETMVIAVDPPVADMIVYYSWVNIV